LISLHNARRKARENELYNMPLITIYEHGKFKPALDLARKDCIVATYGDLLRVPGTRGSRWRSSPPPAARNDLPSFDNSSMDGFAVIASDLAEALRSHESSFFKRNS
jgi:hypothetical protein